MVTGAGGALGEVVCRYFTEKDYTIFGSVSPGKSSRLKFNHPNVHYTETDLTDEVAVSKWFEDVVEKAKKIEAVLMLAGDFEMGSIADAGQDALMRMLNKNFFTAYHISRKALSFFKASNTPGVLVYISAQPAFHPESGSAYAAYTLSKSLLEPLCKIIHAEGNEIGVRAHLLVPGVINTEANRQSMPKADKKNWTQPEDMAEAMHILITNKGMKQTKMMM